MKFTRTNIAGPLILEPIKHGDDRGYFMETFRESHFREHGVNVRFVQDNQSLSKRGTLRGMHYQLRAPQGKLVRVIEGEVFDVAVDMRKSSPAFGQWVGATLSSRNGKQLWVPPGFAHGFYVTSEMAVLCYKCTEYYRPDDEYSLRWDDPEVGIEWPLLEETPLLSSKDESGSPLSVTPLYL